MHFVSSSKKEQKLQFICSADFSCVTIWLNKPLSTQAENHRGQNTWNFACGMGPPSCIKWISKEALRLIIYSHLFCIQFIIHPQHRGTTYTAKVTASQTMLLMLLFKLCRMVSSSAVIWLNQKHVNGAMWEVWCNSLVLPWSASDILHCYSTPYICQSSLSSLFDADLFYAQMASFWLTVFSASWPMAGLLKL